MKQSLLLVSHFSWGFHPRGKKNTTKNAFPCLLSPGELLQHQEAFVANLFGCWWGLELSDSMQLASEA